jgi:hypothetical protein
VYGIDMVVTTGVSAVDAKVRNFDGASVDESEYCFGKAVVR